MTTIKWTSQVLRLIGQRSEQLMLNLTTEFRGWSQEKGHDFNGSKWAAEGAMLVFFIIKPWDLY